MNAMPIWPAVLSAALLLTVGFGRSFGRSLRLRQRLRSSDERHLADALQAWEGEGGALPGATERRHERSDR